MRQLRALSLIFFLMFSQAGWSQETTPTPWFTGPLIAPHGTVVPLGNVELDWYLFFTTYTGRYTGNWSEIKTPNFYQLSPQLLSYIGLTSWMDLNIIPGFSSNWTEGHESIGWNDLVAGFDFQLYPSDADFWFPGIKVSLREVFPIGKYDHLNPKKLGADQTGLGSFTTLFGLVFYKIYSLWKAHFLSLTLSGEYGISAPTHVRGVNAFGGGEETRGTIKQGDIFQAICSFEYNLTKNWALALDTVWNHSNASYFSGTLGMDAEGSLATMDNPSSELLSFCPSIEYNFSEAFGIIAGCWFSAIGRNSSEFKSAAVNLFTFF